MFAHTGERGKLNHKDKRKQIVIVSSRFVCCDQLLFCMHLAWLRVCFCSIQLFVVLFGLFKFCEFRSANCLLCARVRQYVFWVKCVRSLALARLSTTNRQTRTRWLKLKLDSRSSISGCLWACMSVLMLKKKTLSTFCKLCTLSTTKNRTNRKALLFFFKKKKKKKKKCFFLRWICTNIILFLSIWH